MQSPYVLRVAGALLLAGLSFTGAAFSQTTYTWSGAGDGNWGTAANWNPGVPVDAGAAPENIIRFDNTSVGLTSTMNLTSGFDLSQIIVTNPSGPIILRAATNENKTIDLWPVGANGTTIDMSNATQDLTIALSATSSRILTLNVGNAAQTWNVASFRTLTTLDVDGNVANILTLTGGGTIAFNGTSDNSSLRVTVTGAGTLVTLGKTSSAGVHALGGNATSVIDVGTTMRITATGGDQVFVQHDMQVDGTFDLGGTTEGFDGLSSAAGSTTGIITNSGATASVLRINENGTGGNFGGSIQDGAGGMSLVKVHTGTQVFAGNNTYTGTTTLSRGVTQLLGANGAISGSTTITLDAFGELRLDSRTGVTGFAAGVNNNRINDSAAIEMRGGVFSVYGVSTADVSERVGALNVTMAHNTVRLSSDLAAGLTTTGLTMASLSRSAGASLNFVGDQIENVINFGTTTSGIDGVYARVVTGGISSSLFSGGTVGTGVNRLLVGIYGSGSTTTANASDFLTVESNIGGFDYLRPLLASEYATLTGGQFVENAANVAANTTMAQSSAYNALKVSGGALTVGAGKVLFLGGHAADSISSTVTQGAGMVLITGGTGITGGTSILGTLDFGTREAMFRAVGGTANIDARIAGSGGLVKSGTSAVLLNNANTFTGNVYVNEGTLQVRNDKGLGAGPGTVYVNGSGSTTQLQIGLGVNITDKNVILGATGGVTVAFGVAAAQGHNTWGGDVIAANTGLGGRPDSDSNIQVAAETALTIYGNVYGAPGAAPADPTFYGTDPNFTRRINFSGSGAGVLNFAGVISDLASGAAATTPVDRLRINMTGSAELNVNIYNSLKVSGLLHLQQGYLRYVGDGNFFDSSTNATDRGVIMEATGTASQIALLLTKAGQSYSRRNVAGGVDIQVGNGGSDSIATTLANILVGGENETGVVTFGTGLQRLDFAPVAGSTTAVSRFRDVRLYARQGGEVNFLMDFLDDTGFGLTNEIGAITKVGLGTVRLTGRSGAANDVDGGVYALGGTLLLDYSTVNSVKVQAAEGAQFTTAGGDLRLIRTSTGSVTEKMSGTLTVRAGGSEVSVNASAGTINLDLATNTGSSIVRQTGGTINFVESGAGTANIRVGLAANVGNRLGSYATYGTTNNQATGWAFIGTSNAVSEYTHVSGELNTFGTGLNTDLTVNQTLASATTTNSIRINNTAVTSVNLGTAALTVTEGGILIGSGHTGPLTISNGSLTTGNANDLIIHNYGTGGLTISADITGATQSVTYAGTGVTTLTGAKTYTGTTYLVGGTLSIAANDSLGNAANALYFNGGKLQTTTSFTTDRIITIGGDAAYIETAGAGTTTTLTGAIRSEGNFIYTETNTSIGGVVNPNNTDSVGVGDIIKSGLGTLAISNTTNTTFQGLMDVREGTLLINLADSTANQTILGTNESWLDATIVRSGAALTINKPGSNIAVLSEWFRFEDNTILRITGGGRFQTTGLMEVQGALTVDVASGNQLDQQGGGGYMFGDGHITKTGTGTYMLLGNNNLFTGGITIREGILGVRGQGQITGSDYTEVITIDGNTANNTEYRRYALSDFTNNQLVENHNFIIQGTGTGTKRIGVSNGSPPNGDDFLDFNGTITVNAALELNVEMPANTRVHTAYMRFNGSYLGTAGVSTRVVNGNSSFVRTGVFELNANNSAWSGGLTVGNTSDSAFNIHIVRLGNNNALESDNSVTLRHNSRLQAGGRTVTAGNLITSGLVGATSNEIVENAAHADGTIAFNQTTNGTWDALFRDGTPIGTIYEDAAGSAAGKLNLVKEGSAVAILTLDNTYTGGTTVNAGTLQVGAGGDALNRAVGDTGTGATTSVLTVNSGGRVAGTGTVQGVASTTTHFVTGTISPGDVTGAVGDPTGIGTLTVVGNLNVSSGTIQLQAANNTYNDLNLELYETGTAEYNQYISDNIGDWEALSSGSSRGDHDLLDIKGQLTLDSNSTVSLTYEFYLATAGDIFDLMDWIGALGGSFDVGSNYRNGGNGGGDLYLPTLGAGLVYDLSRFTSNGIIIVANEGVVPEPGRALLLVMGLASVVLRRRRRSVR